MKIKSNKVSDIRTYSLDKLNKVYPAKEAEKLLDMAFEALLGITKIKRFLDPELRVSESEMLKIHFACKDLLKQKPIQYILAYADFYDLRLGVDPNVLIPRPETEELVELIIKDYKAKPGMSVLDIGTGSGAIALALKNHLDGAEVMACDISEAALTITTENSKRLSLDLTVKQADILCEESWVEFPMFDIIVSNPPYVTESDKKQMQTNVLDFEPGGALFIPDQNPLLFYRKIAAFTVLHLKPGGRLYFEINEAYGLEMLELLKEFSFQEIELQKDLSDRHRMIYGTKPTHKT